MESSLKTETSTIDGLEVTVTEFPARAASRLLHRLSKGILPALAAAFSLSKDAPVTDLAPVIADLLMSMSEDESDELLAKIFGATSVLVDGKQMPLSHAGMIDRAFSGRLLTMYKAAAFAVKVNYGDFINAALSALAARSKAAPASPSKSEMP